MIWVEWPGLQTVPQTQPCDPFSIPNTTEVCLCWGKSWCRVQLVLEVLWKVFLLAWLLTQTVTTVWSQAVRSQAVQLWTTPVLVWRLGGLQVTEGLGRTDLCLAEGGDCPTLICAGAASPA